MYPILLSAHSLFRWLVLAALIIALINAYYGWLSGKQFGGGDSLVTKLAVKFAHIQLLIGLVLFIVSPLITFFLSDFSMAVKDRQIRFFVMEHNLLMLIAIILITVGAAKARKKVVDSEKFKTIAVWFTLGFIIIMIMIPWSFSPMVQRPEFRMLMP